MHDALAVFGGMRQKHERRQRLVDAQLCVLARDEGLSEVQVGIVGTAHKE